jgi:hypothetical protein
MCGPSWQDHLLAKLGKHRTGVSCLYVRRLADVDVAVLRKLIEAAARQTKRKAG